MKKIFTLACAVSLGAISVFGNGKGDQVRATNVFDGKLLTSISLGRQKSTLTYNENNQLIAVSAPEEKIQFDYTGGEIDGFSYDVTIIENEEGETLELYILLNDEFFASEIYEIEKEIGSPTTYDKWSLQYNEQGQLCKVTRSEGNEITTITYEDGNITQVIAEEKDDRSTNTYDITYPDQIENVSGFMLLDSFCGIDLDEMEIAYFAGLLGQPTKYLPQKRYDREDRETEVFKWTIDSEGYPTKLNFDEMTFNLGWTEAAGINGVENDPLVNVCEQYFSINGMPLSEPKKGLNIIRHSDGKVSKVIIR